MIVSEIRYGEKPVLKAYHGIEQFYQRFNGVRLVETTATYNGMTVSCQNGVMMIGGNATGNVFMRFSNSYVAGASNTVVADPSYTIVPAGKTTTLSAELLGGSYVGVEDDFNIVLRDSGNAAAVNLKFSSGARTVTAAHANAVSVFCLYFRAGFTANGLVILPKITYV